MEIEFLGEGNMNKSTGYYLLFMQTFLGNFKPELQKEIRNETYF